MLLTMLVDPDEDHRYLAWDVLESLRWDVPKHAWTVKVRVALDAGLINSALTFFRTRRDRVAKRRKHADSVWIRG